MLIDSTADTNGSIGDAIAGGEGPITLFVKNYKLNFSQKIAYRHVHTPLPLNVYAFVRNCTLFADPSLPPPPMRTY